MRRSFCTLALSVAGVLFAGVVHADTVPESARPGVCWHWMGSAITRAGIVGDLDYFKRMGIGSATIFGIADTVEPWATPVGLGPFGKTVAFSPEWWELVRFACVEAEKRGIAIGLHNCPGYTSSGGPWIPSRLAMRELVFNVSATNPVPERAHAVYPVWLEEEGTSGFPRVPARRSDVVDIAVVGGIRVSHVPTGSFNQPAQSEARGLECDKLSVEAVTFHLDHVLGQIKEHLGDQVGRGLKYLFIDSYEAGSANWTPRMREEFRVRKGYDCVPFLPVLGGFPVADAERERRFTADYDEVCRDLYRDVFLRLMRERTHELGLGFVCQPYVGPFRTSDGVAAADRPMTEFWYGPGDDRENGPDFSGMTGPDGGPLRVIEAESFTGRPETTAWSETLARLKAYGDRQFLRGVNRFVLHTNPLQPFADDVRPGMTMGRWGTHFGRTQTWAEPARAWFDYLTRCQARLQWGVPSEKTLPVKPPVRCIARTGEGRTVYFVVNTSDAEVSFDLRGRWFDPVTGSSGAAPDRLAPRQSGFLEPDDSVVRPAVGPERGMEVCGTWCVDFGGATVVTNGLFEWTKSADARIRYFSGTARYTVEFACDDEPDGWEQLELGGLQDHVCCVTLNGSRIGTAWTAPGRIALPKGVLRRGKNVLALDYTNVWANRLIGDEQEPDDCEWKAATHGGWYPAAWPEWTLTSIANRPSKGRRAYCTWRHFTRESELVPSGLLGPVRLVRNDPLVPASDVIVVGGGVAGVVAALQAGRAGAKVMLIEQGAQVGGNMTAGGVNWPGLFHAWGRQVIDGCGWELVTNCVAQAGGTLPDFSKDAGAEHWRHQIRVNAALWEALAEEALTKAGVHVCYHSAPMRATETADGWRLAVAAQGEVREVEARVLVDATGNGALSALCGAKRMGSEADRQPGAFTYLLNPHVGEDDLDYATIDANLARAVAEGHLERNDICRGVRFLVRECNAMLRNFADGPDHGTTVANYIENADNSTAELRTETNMRGRAALLRVYRFLRSQPGLERTQIVAVSPEVGVRETWRVEGDYLLTGEDYATGRVFPDSVAYSFYPIDIHSTEKGVEPRHLEKGVVPTVPYRSLLVKGKRNLLVCGRCVSSDRAANSALRVQASCMATGQVAGEAAALAAKSGCSVRELSAERLREELRRHRCVVPPVGC